MINTLIWNINGIKSVFERLQFLKLGNHLPFIGVLEPSTNIDKIHKFQRSLGFSPAFSNTTSNIRIFAKDSLCCSIIDDQEHVLTCTLKMFNGIDIMFSIVYAKDSSNIRIPLWEDINRLSSTTLPWCVAGDLNYITGDQEKEGGNLQKHKKAIPFINCILDCDMIELGFRT